MIRTLIVDDEAPARARLRQLLASHTDVEIAGEAETGIQAMEMAAALEPSLMLLDIQMPGCTGIDVAASLPQPRPHIVFCTAYDQHAVDAFELNAVDYLLKPVSRARLAQTLDRVRSLDAMRREPALDAAHHQPALDRARHEAAFDPARHEAALDAARHEVPLDPTRHEPALGAARHEAALDAGRHEAALDAGRHEAALDPTGHEPALDPARRQPPLDAAQHEPAFDAAQHEAALDPARRQSPLDAAQHDLALDAARHEAALDAPRHEALPDAAHHQPALDAARHEAALDPTRREALPDAARHQLPLDAAPQEAALDRAVRSRPTGPARFLVRNAAHYLVVAEARVLYFASEDGLTRLVADDGQYWMDPSLNELEQRLDSTRFFRVSRAAVINLNAVAQVFPLPGGSGEVLLKNGQRLEVSRRRFRDLLLALGGA